MTIAAETSDTGRSARSKLGWLIVGRVFTALLLFVIGLVWNRTGVSEHSLSKSLIVLGIVAALTTAYSLILRLSRNILFQATLQLAVDILLVTWLVWNSDVILSLIHI